MKARSVALGVASWLPVAAVVAGAVGLVAAEGGYYPRDWMPVALGLVLVLLICLWQGWRFPRSRVACTGLALLAAFAGWCLLSMLWSGLPGDAWEAGDRVVLTVLAAAVLALAPWSGASGRRLLIVWTLAITGALLISALYAAGYGDARDIMINGRIAYPIGYAGGSAALPVLAIAPALLLSSRPETHWALRPLLMAASAFLTLYAILPQSRGAIIGVAAAAVTLLVLAPQRLRVLVRMLALGVIVWAASGPLLDAYTDFEERNPAPDMGPVWRSIALASLVAAAVGAVLPLLENRLPEPREALVRNGRRVVLAGLALLAVLAVVGVAANGAGVRDEAHDRWEEFKGGTGVAASGPARFTETGDPQRYDYWRVSLKALEAEPVAGLGAGNYEPFYAERRVHLKYSGHAHNLWLEILAETGLVGFLLFVGAIVLAVIAVLRGRRGRPRPERAVMAGCLAVTAAVLGHASVDWVDQLPSVAMPGLGLLFVATKVAAPVPDPAPPPRGPSRWIVALLALAALVSILLPYMGVLFSERAAGGWRKDPDIALKNLDRAEKVNPLASRAPRLESAIAIELRRFRRAREALLDASGASDSWYDQFQLALLDAREGKFKGAKAHIDRAAALNPTEPFVRSTRRQIRRRVHLDPRRINRELRRESSSQFR